MKLPYAWRLAALLAVFCLLFWTPAASAQQQTKPDAAVSQDKDKEEEQEKEEEWVEPKLTDEEKKALEAKGCGPKDADHWTKTDKSQHPLGEVSKDKALIYVIRPTKAGGKVQSKLGVDGKWVGINRGNNYFFFTLGPGEHFFCSQSENRSVVSLKVEAGKTYYLQQKVKMGFMKARTKLVVLNKEEGEKGLAKCHPSSFGVKGQGPEMAKE